MNQFKEAVIDGRKRKLDVDQEEAEGVDEENRRLMIWMKYLNISEI